MPQTYVVDNDKVTAFSSDGGWRFTLTTTDEDIVAATSGDLIIYGEGVGFAVSDYNANTGAIQIDLGKEGYEAAVVAEDGTGSAAVEYLSWLYWDAADGEINRDSTNGVPIGQAHGEVAAGETATIKIKLHPTPPPVAGD